MRANSRREGLAHPAWKIATASSGAARTRRVLASRDFNNASAVLHAVLPNRIGRAEVTCLEYLGGHQVAQAVQVAVPLAIDEHDRKVVGVGVDRRPTTALQKQRPQPRDCIECVAFVRSDELLMSYHVWITTRSRRRYSAGGARREREHCADVAGLDRHDCVPPACYRVVISITPLEPPRMPNFAPAWVTS